MRRKYTIHVIAAGIMLIAVAFLPAHLRTTSTQWLYEQVMAFCGPTGVFPIFGGED